MEAFKDLNKKAKMRTFYRNLRMGESESLENFLSKFTTYNTQAGITDNAMNARISKRS